MRRARRPRRSPDFTLDEQPLHDPGQVRAQVLDGTAEGRPNRHRGPVGRDPHLDVHAGRIELRKQRFGQPDVPPVKLLDRVPTGQNDELRDRRFQRNAISEHPSDNRRHPFLDDGHHRWVSSFSHGPDVTGPA